jgi:hypothetical protein
MLRGHGSDSEQLWSYGFFKFSFDMHVWVHTVLKSVAVMFVRSVLILVVQLRDMEWSMKSDTVRWNCKQHLTQVCSTVLLQGITGLFQHLPHIRWCSVSVSRRFSVGIWVGTLAILIEIFGGFIQSF